MQAVIREGGRTYYPGTPAFDRAWVGMQLDRAPKEWQGRIRARWQEMMDGAGEFAANTFLRETSDSLADTLLPMSASDADLRARADALAAECFGAGARIGARGLVDYWRACEAYVRSKGLKPPVVADGLEDQVRAAVARMVCPLWWRRQVRREHGRAIERSAIRLGYVHLKADKYVSQANVWRRVQQKRRNADSLAAVFVVNQHGQEFSLADLAERSTSNPRIRRAELMTRIAGFERIAKDMGHVAEFWTGTAPSMYHAVRSQDGRENPAWMEGGKATPRDAQKHLAKCWARFRAWANRRGLGMYGMRIAEPHHDGCPHWHLLLFMPADVQESAREKFRHYFLQQHSPEERGAQQNRVKFVAIDMTKGSAAGYVIKYVSKNIDGYGVQQDLFGGDAVEGAARVEAWASTWGIRQFQQIGGAPVGVWRELRRLQADDGLSDCVERARAAADAGDWQAYTMEQGGPLVTRKGAAIAPAKSVDGERWDPVAGCPAPAPRTRYGEEPKGQVFGVRDVRKDRAFITRRFKWEIRRGEYGSGKGGNRPVENGRKDSVLRDFRECEGQAADSSALGAAGFRSDAWAADRVMGFQVGGEARGPWTRVNNCTGVDVGTEAGGARREDAGGPGGYGRCAVSGASVSPAPEGSTGTDANLHRSPSGRGSRPRSMRE